jgi:hypothetical protein
MAFSESIEISREADAPSWVAMTTHSLGNVALERGDLDAAQARYRSGLEIAIGVGGTNTAAYCLAGLAAVAARRGAIQLAGQLWGGVLAFEESMNVRLHTSDRARYEKTVEALGRDFTLAAELARDEGFDAALTSAMRSRP